MRPSILGAAGLMLYISYAGQPTLVVAPDTATLSRDLPAASTCPQYQICLYPQENYGGKPMIVTEPDGTTNHGKCVRQTVGSVVDNDVAFFGIGQADRSTKNYETHLRVYDNPTCNATPHHRSKLVYAQTADPHLSFGGPSRTGRSFQLSAVEFTGHLHN
jgi:peptidase inhibitor family I36